MSRTTTPAQIVHREFERQGASTADRAWADTAMSQFFLTDGVRFSAGVNALNNVAHEIGETGRSAQELHGDATAWAHAQVQRWQEAGTDAFVSPATDVTLRNFFIYGAVASCVIALFFIPGIWLSGSTSEHISFLIAPVMMGFITVAFTLVFQYLNVRRGFGVAVAASVGIIALGAVLTALTFSQLQKLTAVTVSVWWMLVVAMACAVLAWVLSQVLPDSQHQRELALISSSVETDATHLEPAEKSSFFDPDDVHAWETLFVGELRSSGRFTETDIQQEVSRKRDESEEVGQHPYELFGHPVAYARSLHGHPDLKRKRLGIFFSIISVLWAALLVYFGVSNGWDWTVPTLYIYLALVALSAWRAVDYLRK